MRLSILFGVLLSAHTGLSQTDASIEFESATRTFHYYLPQNPSTQFHPLIFVLHGATQTGNDIASISLMHEEATDAIVVYPDGQSNTWNVGLPLGGSWNDVGFLDSLVSLFVANFQADPARVYFCGFSAGGYMSYRMACESAHCIAAIGSVSGTMVSNIAQSCSPSHAIPVMHFHGTSDGVVSYDGSSFSGYSVNEVMQAWKGLDGCAGDSMVIPLPNISSTDFSTVEKIQYTACTGDAEIVLFKITGGGHTWPDNNVLLGGVGAINRDIHATTELRNFFNNNACPQNLLTIDDINDVHDAVYPNPCENILHIPVDSRAIMFNQTGQEVEIALDNRQAALDLSALPAGVYFLYINEQAFYRVVKMP